jgi:hypothetical protein
MAAAPTCPATHVCSVAVFTPPSCVPACHCSRPNPQVVAPLLHVLKHLHSRGIIHRDIKPENIFFEADGKLVLGDFGLAIDSTKDKACSRVGTQDYMAPEVSCKTGRCWLLEPRLCLCWPMHTFCCVQCLDLLGWHTSWCCNCHMAQWMHNELN